MRHAIRRCRKCVSALGAALLVSVAASAAAQIDAPLTDEELAPLRAHLAEQVAEHARLAAPMTGRPVIAPAIMDAIRALPRHRFVAAEAAAWAYFDIALPAEHGLRESQPYIVALMTDLAAFGPDADVLILGVGGGYHAALARRLGAKVRVVDLDPLAIESVGERLVSEGHAGIELRAADPYDGWPEPGLLFDAIIVRLAIDRLPPLLLRQLAPGGRLVAPIGRAEDTQTLALITVGQGGRLNVAAILPVNFMRLGGGERI